MRIAELQNLVADQIDGSPGGIQARFIPIDKKWAIKVFIFKCDRDKAYDAQKLCLEAGWAPELGGKVDLPEGYFKYGYVTEIVETLPNVNISNRDKFLDKYGYEALEEAEEAKQVWISENVDKLDSNFNSNRQLWREEIYNATGWYFDDYHCYNWGKKDGKWIPIDFG